jgi:hypothetical protein
MQYNALNPTTEKRRNPRIPTSNIVGYLLYDGKGNIVAHGKGRVISVSMGGTLLQTENKLNGAFIILMAIDLDGNKIKVYGKVIISRSCNESGYHLTGIEFAGSKVKKRQVLVSFVKTYHRKKHCALENSLTKRIIRLFLKMTLEDRLRLLTELELKQQDALNGIRRKYYRQDCFIGVDYSIKNFLHKGFSTNLSANGIFIESPVGILSNCSPGDQAILSFDHPGKKEHMKVTGRIARIDKEGIGVMFNQPIIN